MRVLRVHYRNLSFYASLGEGELTCLNKELGFTEPIPLKEVMVLPPVMPTKIICAAVNYRAHGEEMDHPVPVEPVLFMKPPSSVVGSGQPIILPAQSSRVDYEGELAVVMGKPCHDVEAADMAPYIFGYACANDVTARDLQKRDGQFTRAKGFDTFCPIGPWIETQVENPADLPVRTLINGEVVQEGHTSEMLFPPFELVSFISRIMTLTPGDVILTGTPAGVGPISPGDEVRVEIERVGILINPVVAADGTSGADTVH